MGKMIFIGCLVFISASIPVQAQFEENKQALHPNLSWAVAYSTWDELLPEGYFYSPIALFGRYTFSHWNSFNLYTESQIARAKQSDQISHDYEFGFNLGIEFYQRLAPNLAFAASVGSGPYYITVKTKRQAPGFIFSDNFELGLYYYLSATSASIDVKVRFRHISNAGLKSPNGGIDNLFLAVGVSHFFR